MDSKSLGFTCSFTSPVMPPIAPYKKGTGPRAAILSGLAFAGMAEIIFLHFPVSWLPQPQHSSAHTHTLVPLKFRRVMPSNCHENPIAAIPQSALKIWALCVIPDRQSIKLWQTIQAQSLAWPAFATDRLFLQQKQLLEEWK